MKKILLLLLALCTTELYAQQGWYWQNPLPQGNYLYEVSGFDANIVIAVGASGTVIKSTDGGTNWTATVAGSSHTLYGVSLADANTATAVGAAVRYTTSAETPQSERRKIRFRQGGGRRHGVFRRQPPCHRCKPMEK